MASVALESARGGETTSSLTLTSSSSSLIFLSSQASFCRLGEGGGVGEKDSALGLCLLGDGALMAEGLTRARAREKEGAEEIADSEGARVVVDAGEAGYC